MYVNNKSATAAETDTEDVVDDHGVPAFYLRAGIRRRRGEEESAVKTAVAFAVHCARMGSTHTQIAREILAIPSQKEPWMHMHIIWYVNDACTRNT